MRELIYLPEYTILGGVDRMGCRVVGCVLAVLIVLGCSVSAVPSAGYFDGAFDPFSAPHWESGVVTISISGQFTSRDEEVLRDIIEDFNYYCIPVDLQFHPFGGNPDIKVFMLPKDEIEREMGPNIAGYCLVIWDSSNHITSATCFVSNDIPAYERNIMYHEILHGMGFLYHSNLTSSIMYRMCYSNELSADDIDVMQSIYGFWQLEEFGGY